MLKHKESGDMVVKMFQLDSTENIYKGYLLMCDSEWKNINLGIFEMGVFGLNRIINTKCPYCDSESTYNSEQIEEHKRRRYNQESKFKEAKLALKEGECLIVQDFAKHYFKDQQYFSDLVIVVYEKRRNDDDTLELWRYYDYILNGFTSR